MSGEANNTTELSSVCKLAGQVFISRCSSCATGCRRNCMEISGLYSSLFRDHCRFAKRSFEEGRSQAGAWERELLLGS